MDTRGIMGDSASQGHMEEARQGKGANWAEVGAVGTGDQRGDRHLVQGGSPSPVPNKVHKV